MIGHRGEERVPLLLATIESLRQQRDCPVEILVVEQSATPVLGGKLAEGVRWIHQEPPDQTMPYSRAWAFNAGAKAARGRIIVLHDNDILAPSAYAAELVRLALEGWDAMHLMRYLFDVDEATTESLTRGLEVLRPSLRSKTPTAVRENLQGGTIAITRECYLRIGGHDEGFVGWGGEDNEFYDRCRLVRSHSWAYLPFVHLWHAPQPQKLKGRRSLDYFERVMGLPREERARRLAVRPMGSPEGPAMPLEV